MKKAVKESIFLLFIILLGGCKQSSPSPSSDYMIFDDVVYVKQFPKSFVLEDGEHLSLDVIGASSLSIKDSLLIISTSNEKGYWSVFSLPDHKLLGNYILKGNGPNEMLSSPRVNQQSFYKENGELHTLMYDFQTGNSFVMNVDRTLQAGQLDMVLSGLAFPRTLFGFKRLNATSFLCREVSNDHTQQIRYMINNGKKETPEFFHNLNGASVRTGKDINILSVGMGCSHDGKRVVETALGLNQINLYSVDGTFAKTICVGKQLDNISQVQDKEGPDRMYTYMSLNVHPEFFGALYLNDTDGNHELGLSDNPVIQIFDWDGTPLAEIRTDRSITTYDIDFINGYLYTLNYNTEEMYRYDIGNILSSL